MKKIHTAVAATVLSLCASSAMAAVVTIESVYGEWTNTTPGDVYGLNIVTDASSSVMSWGDPVNDVDQSAYTFEGLIPPPIVVDTATNAQFDLGIFTHDNFAIWMDVPEGSFSITSADLSVQIGLDIDGTEYTLNQVYTFNHDETRNDADPCAYGDADINSNGCADRVDAVLNQGLSAPIVVDGFEYTLDISGFRLEDELLDYFLTREGEENSAILVGELVVREVPEVPLPASSVLLLGGLAGMAMVRRRRRA